MAKTAKRLKKDPRLVPSMRSTGTFRYISKEPIHRKRDMVFSIIISHTHSLCLIVVGALLVLLSLDWFLGCNDDDDDDDDRRQQSTNRHKNTRNTKADTLGRDFEWQCNPPRNDIRLSNPIRLLGDGLTVRVFTVDSLPVTGH